MKNSTNKMEKSQKMAKITDNMIRNKAYGYLEEKGDLGKGKWEIYEFKKDHKMQIDQSKKEGIVVTFVPKKKERLTLGGSGPRMVVDKETLELKEYYLTQ